MSALDPRWLAPVVVLAAAPVQAEVYFELLQVQQTLFPGETLAAQPLALSAEQRQAIATATRLPISDAPPRVWRASGGGWLYVDRVIGKHDYITYAVALNAHAAVRQVEIMEYRESYGGQVRNARWRGQFAGKKNGDALNLNRDIRNISGATLSCTHVTEGIRRLLATHALVFGS